MLYENCGQKTEVKPKKCVCELLWCVRRKEKSPGTGGKAWLYTPRASSDLLAVKVISLGDQGNSSRMSRFNWKTSGFEGEMSEFEWKMNGFKGKGAAEADELLEVPATG